jgi:nanoRNase/pAp phosphatase (c-di-AMP/oligoRNAs hydrolase)
VIYEYYKGAERFAKLDGNGLMAAVDKSDSGDLELEDIRDPKGWILLAFIMDPRTGLGRFRDYRIGNYQLMEDMIGYCRKMTAEQILELPDVKERVERYGAQQKAFEEALKANTRVDGNVIVTDFRNLQEIPSGNRFTVYALYPEQNISILALWGKEKRNVVFTMGHSIVKRGSNTDVGSLMLRHGGGGHQQVGTCQVKVEDAERVLGELVKKAKADG